MSQWARALELTSGWHFEVVIHKHLVRNLEERMSAAAESIRELGVKEDDEAPPSCCLETSVVSSVSA